MTKTLRKTLMAAAPRPRLSSRMPLDQIRTLPANRHVGLQPALHDPETGRLNARRIADWFDLPVAGLARALGRSSAAVHKTPAALSLQAGLAVYQRIGIALSVLAGSEAGAKIWLHTLNPDLEGNTPNALLRQGQAEIVASLLDDALAGQPG